MERLKYIDALRAFSIFLIVYSHLVHYGLQKNISIFNEWSNTFMVPLFFFISGFVSYKSNTEYKGLRLYIKKNKNKFKCLIVSPLIFLLVYCFYRNNDYLWALGDPLKNGYWFTIVLFQIIIIANIQLFIKRNMLANACMLISTVLMMIGVFVISKFNNGSEHPNITDYFSWMYVTYYYYYYILGLMCRKYEKNLIRLISNKIVCSALFIFSFIPLTANGAVNYIPVTARIIAIYYLFYVYREFFEMGGVIIRLINYVGKHTLEIYFIHYFLLFRFNCFVPVLSSRPFVEMVLLGVISCAMILMCLFIRKIIMAFMPIDKLLFSNK